MSSVLLTAKLRRRTGKTGEKTPRNRREDAKDGQMGRGKESNWAEQRKQSPETETSRNKTEQR
jgi:hypothetical protein